MTNETDNVVQMPSAVTRIVAQIKADLKRRAAGDKEWIDGTYDLCIHLAELRGQFSGNIEFGRACEENGLGRSVINHQTRAIAVTMGKEPDALLECLMETDRRSIETIYRLEFPRFTNVRKTTGDDSENTNAGVRKTNPRGRRPEKLNKALATYDLFERDGRPISEDAIATAAGVGAGTANKAISMRRLAETIKPEVAPLDLPTAAPSTRARMEAWQRAETKRLREVLYSEIKTEVGKEFDGYVSHYSERIARADRIQASHKGLLSKKAYLTIVKCLHPDTTCDEAQKAEAFRLFTSLRDVLIKPDDPVFSGPPLPRTIGELLARKKTKR